MIARSVCIFLLLVLPAVPSGSYPRKQASVKLYSPVVIHSSRVVKDTGVYKRCLMDVEFRNFSNHKTWIIFNSPADILMGGKAIFKEESPVKIESRVERRAYKLIISGEKGKGFTGIYLDAGVQVRVKEFGLSLTNYPGNVRIITARELRINGKMSLEKWIVEQGRSKKFWNISFTVESLKRVETVGQKAWIYPVGNEKQHNT